MLRLFRFSKAIGETTITILGPLRRSFLYKLAESEIIGHICKLEIYALTVKTYKDCFHGKQTIVINKATIKPTKSTS